MELYQVSIFGEYQQIVTKKQYVPRKLNKQQTIFKGKLQRLYKLYEQLYKYQNISILEQREVIMKDNLVIYPDEQQAEPIETIKMDVFKNIDKKIEIAEKEVQKYQ